MTQYIVSARKYRPDTFESLIGQDNIAQTLKNSIVRGQLAHAYLFCGPRGVGKTSTARIFAKTINCSNPTADMEPCGECESCRSFAEGRSYCIHELDAASNNGVEDIKSLMDQVRIPPQVGRYSVYIIDEVHMLSQAAFNAFLKTLEEPPAHAIFILATTEKHKILPTILSRCQTYDFNRITVDNIVKNLRSIAIKENINIDDESLHVIASKADGAMRDALTIFDQTVAFCGTDVHYEDVLKNLNVLDYEYSFRLTDAFLAGDYPSCLLIFDEILTKGFNALHFVAALSSHFRDLMVSRAGGLDALLELPDSLKRKYRDQAAKCPLKFLYDALTVTTQCEAGYRASVNPRLHIEYALMKLCFLMKAPASEAVAAPTAPNPAAASSATATSVATPMPSVAASASSIVVQASHVAVPATPAPPVAPAVPSPVTPAAETAKPAAPAQEKERPSRPGMPKLSIKSMMSAAKGGLVSDSDNPEDVDDVTLSDDAVKAKWGELADYYMASKPRLAMTVKNAKVTIGLEDGNKILTFFVSNVAQRDWIREKCLHEMEGAIRKLSHSSRLLLRVDVSVDENAGQEAYMPGEKAKKLMEENPEVKNLVKDLGLDIK
ncbi:MAG: DNA polymerase III subunit gamma/tau [Candidatus Cryptobacteroides sp.]